MRVDLPRSEKPGPDATPRPELWRIDSKRNCAGGASQRDVDTQQTLRAVLVVEQPTAHTLALEAQRRPCHPGPAVARQLECGVITPQCC